VQQSTKLIFGWLFVFEWDKKNPESIMRTRNSNENRNSEPDS
jgi:hypothetical protein